MLEKNKVKRTYNIKDATMIITGATISSYAMDSCADLEQADESYTYSYLLELHSRFEAAAKDVLKIDSASQIHKIATDAHLHSDKVIFDLGITKGLIETKFANDPTRRDELLNNLGFRTYYHDAASGSQHALNFLMNRLERNLSTALVNEMAGKGISLSRVNLIRQYAASYIPKNQEPENSRTGCKQLTDEDLRQMNRLYQEISGICKTAQRLFKDDGNLYNSFVFTRVANNTVNNDKDMNILPLKVDMAMQRA